MLGSNITINANSTMLPFTVQQTRQIPTSLSLVNVASLFTLASLICCIIGGNVLVICAFITVGRKIRTITNYFVVSLAVSDILVGVFSVPFWMLVQISKSFYIFEFIHPRLQGAVSLHRRGRYMGLHGNLGSE